MLQGAELTLSADVNADGAAETGRFDLSKNVELSPRIRTGPLIGPTGSTVGALVDSVTGDEQGRAGFRLDAGGGAFVVDINFISFTGSDGRWGDGSSDPMADAEGEGPLRQMSVFLQYLNVGTFDSENAGTLEFAEYSSSGEYTPIAVAPEEPQVTYAANDKGPAFDGSITLVATRSISQAAISQAQDGTR